LFLSKVEFNDTPTRYSSQNYHRNYYYRKESYVPVWLERVRDCFPNCLCVAMEERPKVNIARKSLELSFIVCPLQRCPRFQFLITQLPRIAILHAIDRS